MHAVSTIRRHLLRPERWTLGFCLLTQNLNADVRITEVFVNHEPKQVSLSSSHNPLTKPVRIAASFRNLQFHFTETGTGGIPRERLRYKLEGHDHHWRDVQVQMRILLQFRDGSGQTVGVQEFPMQGETPGWHGSVEDSIFQSRQESVAIPPNSVSAQLSVLSHGGDQAIGVLGVDALRVLIERPDAETTETVELHVTEGAGSSQPLGTRETWMREAGSRPDIARLGIRSSPTPHPFLVLHDNDASHFGNWSQAPHRLLKVSGATRLTLEWETAHSIGRSGPGAAEYPMLKPGQYWFRVAVAKVNGELTGQEVTVPILVTALFHQRVEAWLMLGLLTCGGGVGFRQYLVQRRIQRRLAEMERQQSLERELARIARDLHDDIGAGLTEIAMQSDWVRRDISAEANAETVRRITRVCESAIELTRSVDEIVWAVNPANDTVDRFANYLIQATKQFADAAGLRVRFDIPAELPAATLPGKVRHCLFLVVREALNNTAKHAKADLVRLVIRVELGGLFLTLRDNGCGFESAEARPAGAHEGLENMRRRIGEVGGRFHLTSHLSHGTDVEFFVPLDE